MASASLAVVAFLAVVATAVSQSMRQNSPDQNTWNAMVRVKPSCENTYNNVVAPYFANDPACKAQVEKALKTYNKTECPETNSGSFVWNCMSGWNGNSTDPVSFAVARLSLSRQACGPSRLTRVIFDVRRRTASTRGAPSS